MLPPPRSKSVHWFSTSGQIRTFSQMALPPRLKMTCPRVACTVNYWICEKQHNCRQWSPHVLPVLHALQNYTVGWGKVNQHNVESCCLYFACQTANKHKWFFNDRPLYPTKLSPHKQPYSQTHTHCTNSLPHTSIMSFIKGSTCGLMDHCECHSHWRYCIHSNKMLLLPVPLFFFFWETVCGALILQMMMYLRCRKKCLLSKYSSFNRAIFPRNYGSLWM